jgi:hypothetical protein
MGLNKKQLAYGGVLAVAAGAFLWDRVTSTPMPAEAASAAVASAAKPAEAPVASASPGAARQSAHVGGTSNRENVADRLKSAAATHGLNVDEIADAFAVPADWVPKAAAASGKTPDNNEDVEAARAFAEKHVLNAVMVQSRRGYAIVDGQGVFVGSTVGKYKLMSVTKETAIFARDTVRVELRLGEKPRVWRESADPAGGDADNKGTARTE